MIILPDFFNAKLAEAPRLASGVHATFERFEPWLEQSGMPFFPGFTDHSPRHISDVLKTASSLISDEAHELIGAEDIAVLCMAVLLHDCGMHLTQDMFRDLIADSSAPIVGGLGDKPWATLWSDFCSEANRFGQDKLVAIFGDSSPIRINEIKLDNLGERDCLLIGEFVRRHHARLAHEIAIKGVRRPGGEPLELVGLDLAFRDISGLVARSHGMSIRSTFEYVKNKYGLLASFRAIKIPYLMAVLRIADYVQVKSERAIRTLLSVKSLKSPVSRQEWNAHFAVQDVSTHDDDPEALYVHAEPVDVKTFLKLVALFKDIQRELDESWATLGEVYGRRGPLAGLGLTIRRIRSNIDDALSFGKNSAFYPVAASFASSGPDLLKLLIAPLYDYKYEVGVRELMQNAVDACREFDDAEDVMKDSVPAGVTVAIEELEDRSGWLTVSDTGIGMTLDTVRDYYLVAGASFRNSELWKAKHVDEEGDVRITRGGRFGVGALAAFLLGEEVNVETRHADCADDEGISFAARVDDPAIELRKARLPRGTTIKIRISNPDVLDALRPRFIREWKISGGAQYSSWRAAQWFRQEFPTVVYRWDGFDLPLNESEERLKNRVRLSCSFKPSDTDCVPLSPANKGDWHELADAAPYRWVIWRFEKALQISWHHAGYVPLDNKCCATVNGIFVESYDLYSGPSERAIGYLQLPDGEGVPGLDYLVGRPSIAISDPLGVAPINLQRSAVAFDRMGIDEKLGLAILTKNFRAIADDVVGCKKIGDLCKLSRAMAEMPHITFSGQSVPVCAVQGGVMLATPANFAELDIRTLVYLDTDREDEVLSLRQSIGPSDGVMVRRLLSGPSIQSDLEWFRGFFNLDAVTASWDIRQAGLFMLPKIASAGIFSSAQWDLISRPGKVRKEIMQHLKVQLLSADQVLVQVGDPVSVAKIADRLVALNASVARKVQLFACKFEAPKDEGGSPRLIERAWSSVFGSNLVRAGRVKIRSTKAA